MTCARPQLFPRDGVGTSGWQSTIHGWLADDARLATTRGAIHWVAYRLRPPWDRRPKTRRTPWPAPTQAPPKHHPNRPERSTATERPDTNQEQVDHHVGEEDTIERLPGRTGRPFLYGRGGRRQRRQQSGQVGHGRIEVAEGRGRVDALDAFGQVPPRSAGHPRGGVEVA